MWQFYDVYVNKPKLAPQVRVLAWTHNLMIMGQNKRPEEREFYLRLAVKAKWSKRELAHQINTAAFERTVLSDKKLAPAVRVLPQDATGIFKDSRRLSVNRATACSSWLTEWLMPAVSHSALVRCKIRSCIW
jgi:hypothetical protein